MMRIYHHKQELRYYMYGDTNYIDVFIKDNSVRVIWLTDPDTFAVVFGGVRVGGIFCRVKEVKLYETN